MIYLGPFILLNLTSFSISTLFILQNNDSIIILPKFHFVVNRVQVIFFKLKKLMDLVKLPIKGPNMNFLCFRKEKVGSTYLGTQLICHAIFIVICC